MTAENLTYSELSEKPLFVNVKKPYNRLSIAGVQWIFKILVNERMSATFIFTGYDEHLRQIY